MQVSLVDAGLSRSLSRARSLCPPLSLSLRECVVYWYSFSNPLSCARALSLSRARSLSASLFISLSLSLFLCLSVSRSLAPSHSCVRARSLSLYTHSALSLSLHTHTQVPDVHKVSCRTHRVLLIHVSTLLDELLNLFDLLSIHRKQERVLAAVIAQHRLQIFVFAFGLGHVERSYAILQGAGVSVQVTRAHTERHTHAYSRTPKRTRTRGVCVCARAGVYASPSLTSSTALTAAPLASSKAAAALFFTTWSGVQPP